jgi:adenosine/AMP kinase
MEGTAMELKVIDIIKPDDVNVVLGQSHFIKTVEDVHEALVTAVPGIKFGFAFCEASGKRLVRWTGTDPAMIALARGHALTIGAGHCFALALAPGYFPINVLPVLRAVPEMVGFYCATANPLQVVVADTERGRAILGVIDGGPPVGAEGDDDIAWRKGFLRKIGYKL